MYWQTKEAREKLKLYNEFRDRFVQVIKGSYSDLVDTNTAQKYQVLFGDPIAASGINIKEMTLSQAVHNIILVVEEEAGHEGRKNILGDYLTEEKDRELIKNNAYPALENKRISLHEFGHGLFSEQSDAAEKLGSHDDMLAELKSDLAMWVSAGEVLKKNAEEEFGSETLRALQLSMIEDAMKNVKGDPEYKIAAEHILERLIEHTIVKEENGKIIIDTKKLDTDLGPLFENSFRDILSIYKSAGEGKKKDIILARKKAREIIKAKPSEILQKIRKHL